MPRQPRQTIENKPKITRTSAIYVDKADVIEDILADSVISSYHGGPGVGRRGTRRAKDQGDVNSTPSFNESSTSSALSIQERMIKEQMLNRNKQTDAATKMNIQKAMQSRILKQEKEFNKLCTNISDAKAFLAQVDKNLELHEETNRNKTRRQFEDWNTNVHGNIQIKISKQINDIDSKSLNQKKNEDYSKFLEITNRKSAIFRDIIIESEYDPLEPNRRAIKAKTGKLKDPTMIDKQKAEAEAAMLGPGASKANSKKGGKDTLPVELWATGKIEATPYGTFARMMGKNGNDGSEVSSIPKTAKVNATMASNVVFDHFAFPKGKDAIDVELPRGKRVFPTTVYADPGRVFANASRNVDKQLEQIQLMY